ncbi:MAG: hypothetical protein N3A72_09655 [bacterium]|nr:hypothetical protein [bacterium]
MQTFRFLPILCLLIFFEIAISEDATHIYGIHDWGSTAQGLFNGKSRWDVEMIRVGLDTKPLAQIAGEGFTILVRLGKQWGESVPRNSNEWDTFALSCASTVSVYSSYCKRWIIGNEMNANFDSNIPASDYITIFKKCRVAIKTVQPEAEVLVAAVAPWNSSQNPGGPYSYAWLNYMYTLVNGINDDCDGYAIHAYGGRNGDSDPRNDNYWGFGVYKDWMQIIGNNMYAYAKPVYLTEMNCFADGQGSIPGYPKYNYSTGWINKAFEEINNWNRSHRQKIYCACWFAYANGGFPGYNLTLLPQASSDFSYTTQNTNYTIADPTTLLPKYWAIYE